MRRHQKMIMKLVTKELLFSIFDLMTPFFQASRIYRRSVNGYLESRSIERSELLTKIRYWQRQGYIKYFIEGKERYIELTAKGADCLKRVPENPAKISRPERWDGKWRVIIFDVPENRKQERDALRSEL